MPEIIPLTHQAKCLSAEEVPFRLKTEISQITNHRLVLSETIKVFGSEEWYFVELTMKWERGKQWTNRQILEREPVVLRFEKKGLGECPPKIFSNRNDFPRDLAHLNPVDPDSPVSFCVWRNGIQALYDSGGISRILSVLGEWLSDASQDNLEHDGWEPELRLGKNTLSLNIGEFQRYASKQKGGKDGIVFGRNGWGIVVDNSNGRTFSVSIESLKPENGTGLTTKHQTTEGKRQSILFDIPWAFTWGKKNKPVATRFSGKIDNTHSLIDFADHIGVSDNINNALKVLLTHRTNFEIGVFFFVFGIWRPMKLFADVPTDADGDACRIEIIPILIEFGKKNGKPLIERVEQVTLLEQLTPGLLRKTSGLTETKSRSSVTIIGCGAIGSKISEFLCRQGQEKLILVDYDRFQPHNIARHVLGRPYVWCNKAEALQELLQVFTKTEIKAIPRSIQTIKSKERGWINRSKYLLNTSADKRVVDFICNDNKLPQSVRAFLALEGRLGVLMVEGKKHQPRLDDIEAYLFLQARDNDLISKWLHTTSAGQHAIIGPSCSSVTFQIPDSLVTLHAANFMPVLSDLLSDHSTKLGGFGLHITTENGFSEGWEWFPVPEFRKMEVNYCGLKWKIRILPDVLKKISETTVGETPNEIGGFLYGRFNVNRRIVTLVETCCPSPLRSAATGLELPAAAETEEELHLLESSNYQLFMLGSWHSLPQSNSIPSSVDIKTLHQTSFDNNKTPRPYVMLIRGKQRFSAHITLPTSWS